MDAVMEQGDFFGEKSLLTGERRAATVPSVAKVKGKFRIKMNMKNER